MDRHAPLGGKTGRIHQDFIDSTFTEWEQVGVNATEKERERGRRSFVLRLLDEQRSLVAFSEFLTDLCRHGQPIDLIGAVSRIVRDEAAHVDYCQRIVDGLGGMKDDKSEPNWVKQNDKTPFRRRLLNTIIGSMCIGETVSVVMLRKAYENAYDPVAKATLRRMLADESFHSQLGWIWLREAGLAESERETMSGYVTRVLTSLDKSLRPSVNDLARSDAYVLGPFGNIRPRERDEAYFSVVTEKILPGLRDAGLTIAYKPSIR